MTEHNKMVKEKKDFWIEWKIGLLTLLVAVGLVIGFFIGVTDANDKNCNYDCINNGYASGFQGVFGNDIRGGYCQCVVDNISLLLNTSID